MKVAAPEAYSFLDQNVVSLRNLHQKSSPSPGDNKETKLQSLMEKWSNLVKNVSWHSDSARKIICNLFPGFRNQQEDRLLYSLTSENTLQGFVDDSVTDYWIRINKGCLGPDEISDQAVLQGISGWQQDYGAKTFIYGTERKYLADAIFEFEDLKSKIEQFGMCLEGQEIRELASELFERSLAAYGNQANTDNCPGFINLWRLAKKQYAGHDDWLISEIEKASAVSLHFTNELYYYWRHTTEWAVSAKEPTPELRRQIVDMFTSKFQDKPADLLQILGQDNPWGLYHMIYMYRDKNQENWRWIGKVLFEAAKINPRLTSSYIACLISRSDSVHSSDPNIGHYYKNSINDDVIEEIFGKDTMSVMEIISVDHKYPELSGNYMHGQTKSVIQDARETAKKMAEEQQRKHRTII